MTEKEKYRPTPEEIEKAEGAMSDEQKRMSQEREATYTAGKESATTESSKKQVPKFGTKEYDEYTENIDDMGFKYLNKSGTKLEHIPMPKKDGSGNPDLKDPGTYSIYKKLAEDMGFENPSDDEIEQVIFWVLRRRRQAGMLA